MVYFCFRLFFLSFFCGCLNLRISGAFASSFEHNHESIFEYFGQTGGCVKKKNQVKFNLIARAVRRRRQSELNRFKWKWKWWTKKTIDKKVLQNVEIETFSLI